MKTIKSIIFLIGLMANAYAMQPEHADWLLGPMGLQVQAAEKNDFNVLWAAASDTNISPVKKLLIEGKDPNHKNANNQTVLHLLSRRFSVDLRDFPETIEIIKLLVLAGANPHLKDYQGKTALYYARENNYPSDIISLFEQCQSPSLKNQSIKVLAKKITEGSYTLQQAKKDLPADVYENLTALTLNDYDKMWLAAKEGDISTLKSLVVRGINPNATDPIGHNVLFNLIRHDYRYLHPFTETKKELIQLLINAGVSPYMRPVITTSIWGNKNAMEIVRAKERDFVNAITPILQKYKSPTLTHCALAKVGNQIISGKLTIQKAKAYVPSNLHKKLDKYIVQYQ